MSRQRWNNVKASKGFYVQLYRKSLTLLWFSGLLNVVLLLVVWFIHISEPARSYYATNGITAPESLTVLLHRNYGSTALLPSNQEEEEREVREKKLIPQ